MLTISDTTGVRALNTYWQSEPLPNPARQQWAEDRIDRAQEPDPLFNLDGDEPSSGVFVNGRTRFDLKEALQSVVSAAHSVRYDDHPLVSVHEVEKAAQAIAGVIGEIDDMRREIAELRTAYTLSGKTVARLSEENRTLRIALSASDPQMAAVITAKSPFRELTLTELGAMQSEWRIARTKGSAA